MIKKMLLDFLAFLLVLLIDYIACAVVGTDFNVFNWAQNLRNVFVLVLVLGAVVIFIEYLKT